MSDEQTLADELARMANGLRGSMWADRNMIIALLDAGAAALRSRSDEVVDVVSERYWSCEHPVAERKAAPFGVECGLCGYLFSAANPIPPTRPAVTAALRSTESTGAGETKIYKLPVKHQENYGGEHREWIVEYTLPQWLVADIQADARPTDVTAAMAVDAEVAFMQALLDRYSENGGIVDLTADAPAFLAIVRKHAAALAQLPSNLQTQSEGDGK